MAQEKLKNRDFQCKTSDQLSIKRIKYCLVCYCAHQQGSILNSSCIAVRGNHSLINVTCSLLTVLFVD